MAKKKKELRKDEDYRLEDVGRKELDKYDRNNNVRLTLSDETKDKICKIIFKEKEKSENSEIRKEFISHIDYCRKRYTMEDMNTNFPWDKCNSYRTGMTTVAVDRLRPRIHRATWGTGRFASVKPGRNFDDERADRIERWLDYKVREDIDLEDQTDDLEYDAIMLNFGILKNEYVYEEGVNEEIGEYETADELLRNYPDAIENTKYHKYLTKLTGLADIEEISEYIMQRQPLPVSGETVILRERYRDGKSDCKVTRIDPGNMYFPVGWNGDENHESAWIIIEKKEMRRDEILRKREEGFFDDFNDEHLFGTENEDTRDYSKTYDIFEVKMRYDIDNDDLEEDILLWVCKGKGGKKYVFLRGIKFPYMHKMSHWIVFRTDINRYGPYSGGGGIGYKLKAVNRMKDKQLNQTLNAWDQKIGTSYKWVKTLAGEPVFNPKIHKKYPSSIIPVSHPDEIVPFEEGDIPPSTFSIMPMIDREGEYLAGIPSTGLASGQVTRSDPRAPAKKAELLLAEASINIADFVKRFVRGYKKLAIQIQKNTYQFTDETKLYYRAGEIFVGISKGDLRNDAAYSMSHAVKSVSARERAQSAIGFQAMVANNPFYVNNLSAQAYIFQLAAQNWDEEFARNMDRLMPPGMQELVTRQVQEAQREAQIQEYIRRRQGEGASQEEIDYEVAQIRNEQQPTPAKPLSEAERIQMETQGKIEENYAKEDAKLQADIRRSEVDMFADVIKGDRKGER
jgi:hypothetical protein